MNAMKTLTIVIYMQSAQIQTEVFLVPVIMVSREMVLLVQVLTGCDIVVRGKQSFQRIEKMLSHRHFFNRYV